MAQRWIVTASGQDRPGIVAGVTEVLYKLGCNLEDSAMTRLEGEFAVMLIFSVPSGTSAQKLAAAFTPLEKRLKLAIYLKPLAAGETHVPRPAGKLHVISVYGGDKPGIVFQVSQSLAKLRANITNVQTHRSTASKQGKHPLYLMLLEVEVPTSSASVKLERELKRLAAKLGVEVSIRSGEAAVL